ncbi:MAG TPA: alpha-L-fucosidase [Abditibacterium sp.]|jgi:alpha-L-fucosidase
MIIFTQRAKTAAILALLAAAMQPATAQTATPATALSLPIAPGPFQGTAESLKQYQAPDWFRDAKFGIWSHWGPQAVPRQGDWYARRMYLPNDSSYAHHLKTYGHPSVHGYKDIIPLWRAEKWDPDALMALYARAGAKYFVSMGVHHDNFDLWNSRFHAWNAVNMGPHRDVVGDWKRAAQKFGMRFGVSEHLGASYAWFQASHGADRTGPFAGVPYDGANPKFQALYQSNANPPFVGGRSWYTTLPASQQNWYQRISDLVDRYQPDLLYTDGGIPFGEVGRSLIAHLYNSNIRKKGQLEAVYSYKNIGSGEFIPGAGVLDVERGGLNGISAQPWQTDTSIGDWYYSDGYRYKVAEQVIHQLADVVSKNGNLLINVVQYADGSLPPEPQEFLREMAQWMPINGEAIYGTRPWTTYGEGPTRGRAGNFNENTAYTPQDIRFTTKNGAIYALTLGIPTETVRIKSLATGSGFVSGEPTNVTLLGFKGQLKWNRSADGLEIQVPANLPLKHALAFKISGFQTVAGYVPPAPVAVAVDKTVAAQPNGDLVLLPARAELHGETLQVQGSGAGANIGFWDNASEWVSWGIQVAPPGTYRLALETATIHPSSEFFVEIAGRKIAAKALVTGDWNRFTTLDLGEVQIPQAGPIAVSVRPAAGTWNALNLRAVRLVKVK